MQILNEQQKYQAVIENDQNFDGIFYYAVKSTGIFCRPSCKSRAPKPENTLFFNNADEAMQAGFRPCKRCRSDLLQFEPAREIAKQVKQAIEAMFLENNRLNNQLQQVGLSQRQMVEVFKKEYGHTPKAYADQLRLAEAKTQLKIDDRPIIDIALHLGFSSLSAFYRFFKENTGQTPNAYRKEANNE